jgi:hypothetical protein
VAGAPRGVASPHGSSWRGDWPIVLAADNPRPAETLSPIELRSAPAGGTYPRPFQARGSCAVLTGSAPLKTRNNHRPSLPGSRTPLNR